MLSPEQKKPLVILLGPTAVGKTEISIHLAQKFHGEVISADSRTFYRGLDIGTAKPSIGEQSLVRHHLVDVANPDETLSLAIFQKKVKIIIEEIINRGNLPFLVGGTGQYIRAIINNWVPPVLSPNHELRVILERIANEKGKEYLHNALKIIDPESSEVIDSRNVRRTIRALEVIFTTGKLFSYQRGSSPSDYDLITIGLIRPRQDLFQRIDRRIDLMFKNGLIAEVETLLNLGYSETLPSMSAIGYRECIRVIRGEITEEEAVKEIKRKTRIFVRRQANWFKPSDPSIRWFDISKQPAIDIENYIQSRLIL